MLGKHLLRTWSAIQATIAFSSAEAEFYALVEGATRGIGLQAVLEELGVPTSVVELLTAHFVAALGFGRIMEFCFWVYSYHELANSAGSKLPGYLALFSQFMQLVLMLDFFWYYYLAVKNATPLVLPSHAGMAMV